MSIRSLGKGKYIVDYYVIDSITGKRHHTSKRIEGLREAKKFEASIPVQKTIIVSKKTLAQMYYEYESSVESRKDTKIQNKARFNKYVTFKDKPIVSIKKSDLMEWNTFLKTKGLSATTINSIYGFIKNTYSYANDIYGIPNISSCLKRLRIVREEKEILTPSEFMQVVSYETNPIYYAFFYTAFWSSCRRGELKALYKTDLVGDTLYIKRSMRLGEDSLRNALKTGATLKVIKLDQDTLDLLIPLVNRPGKYMFGDETFLTNTSLERHWNICMKKSGINKHITLHSLRHSSGSALLDAGLDIVSVSKRLGHSKVSTTANVYSHLLDKSGQKSVDIINKIKNKN